MYTEIERKGIEMFCANRYWRQIFENAPSEAAKRYYAETFAYSGDLQTGKECSEALHGIYGELSAKDWDYLIANCHNNMGRWGLEQNREKYETKPSDGEGC